MIKMIRDGYYCIYKEKEYELNEDINDNLIILKEDSSKIDLTFIDEYKSGVYSKIVQEKELDEIYKINTIGQLGNLMINVEGETDDSYLVETSSFEIAQKLGLEQCDKYYHQGKILKGNIIIKEEKAHYKL